MEMFFIANLQNRRARRPQNEDAYYREFSSGRGRLFPVASVATLLGLFLAIGLSH